MKPDKKFSERLRKVMEENDLTPARFAKEAETSQATIQLYLDFTPVKKWRDSVVERVAKVMNKYELQKISKEEKENGRKLQEQSEREAKLLRSQTVFERAKVVHALMGSPLLDDAEKQKYVVQFME